MFCSTIIPTIGRPELSRAVESVLNQETDADFEVIVVNDSGTPLKPATWQQNSRVRIIDTNRRERCMARNVGAALAHGQYLHFLDDDDWLLPGAFQSLYELSQKNNSGWLFGGTQLLDKDHSNTIDLHHHMQGNIFTQTMAGEWIPLQSTLVKTDVFFKVGGFDILVVNGEDMDLLRRVTRSEDVVETDALIACVGMGVDQSTTNYQWALSMARHAKNTLLIEQDIFPRLYASAKTPFWYGKIVRLYLGAFVAYLKQKHVLIALSQLWRAIIIICIKPKMWLSKYFWQAIMSTYVSESFLRGFEAANLPVAHRDI